ncbi:hypothetical protein [Sphaerisporangium dianthi]|uniref:Uncharacterized protein n=1 Tax=Sphaerisporangium dianthi TaxID=1436120 RepID=A0ABV9CAZ7_9ACTN
MNFEVLAAYLALTISLISIFGGLRTARKSYVRMELLVEIRDDAAIILTSLTSETYRPKKLAKAFLLIGPEKENPITTFNSLVSRAGDKRFACCAIDFENFDLPGDLTGESGLRLLLPLSYYLEENDYISDETLSCETRVGFDSLQAGAAYSIRFFVYGHRWLHTNLHRKVQRLLIVPGAPPTSTCSPNSVAEESVCKSLAGCHKRKRPFGNRTERPTRGPIEPKT